MQIHSSTAVKLVGCATRRKYLLNASNRAECFGMIEDEQVFGEFVGRGEIDLLQALVECLRSVGGFKSRPGQDDAQRVDVIAGGNAAQQRGFQRQSCRGP